LPVDWSLGEKTILAFGHFKEQAHLAALAFLRYAQPIPTPTPKTPANNTNL